MVLTILRLKSPPRQAAELIQALRTLARPARAANGFISSSITFDADDSSIIQYEERWATREDLDTQIRSSRCRRMLTVMEAATEEPTLEFHFVSETRGLNYLAKARGEGLNFPIHPTHS